uniref:Uncharacterized protein n=1 Tax=Moniliophthora roreri TaxID=221103 RepID=A0A0W0FV82_MONRR
MSSSSFGTDVPSQLPSLPLPLDVTPELLQTNGVADLIQPDDELLDPILHLPEEVILHIFQFCNTHTTSDIDFFSRGICYDTLQTKMSPWYLGQVCRCWRTIVLSCSSLWSYVGVDLERCERYDDDRGLLALLTHQLERSGAHSLTVALLATTGICGYTPSQKRFLDVLCTHSDRWETLRIHFPDGILRNLQELSPRIRGRLPALRRLSIVLDFETRRNPPEDKVIDAFEITPQLCDLHIPYCTGRLANIIRLPWHQIIRYRSYNHFSLVDDDCQFLARMPNLRVVCEFRPFNRSAAFPRLHLPSVRALGVFIGPKSTLESVNSFFNQLSAVDIHEFRYGERSAWDTIPECVPAFLQRSAPNLHTLRLGPWLKCSDDAKIQLLKGLSTLQSLWLFSPTKELLHVLASHDPVTKAVQLLPRLREIGLFNITPEKENLEGSISELMENRRSTDTPLEKIWLSRNHPFNFSQLDAWYVKGFVVDTSVDSFDAWSII